MLTINETKRGIELKFESDEPLQDINDEYTRKGEGIIYDWIERYSCNGSYSFFNAGEGNPFIGLSDAPCIADCFDYEDDGTVIIIGEYYYYPDYMITDWIQELINGETVEFIK